MYCHVEHKDFFFVEYYQTVLCTTYNTSPLNGCIYPRHEINVCPLKKGSVRSDLKVVSLTQVNNSKPKSEY